MGDAIPVIDFDKVVTRALDTDLQHCPICARAILLPETDELVYNLTDVCTFCGYKTADTFITSYIPADKIYKFAYHDLSWNGIRTFLHTTAEYAKNVAYLSRAYYPEYGAYFLPDDHTKVFVGCPLNVAVSLTKSSELCDTVLHNVTSIELYEDENYYKLEDVLKQLDIDPYEASTLYRDLMHGRAVVVSLITPVFKPSMYVEVASKTEDFCNEAMITFLVTHSESSCCAAIRKKAGYTALPITEQEKDPAADLCEELLDKLITMEKDIAKLKQLLVK